MAKAAKNRDHEKQQHAGAAGFDETAEFDRRLKEARDRLGGEGDAENSRGRSLATAFRMSSELIAGLLVGGFIGWQLDYWLETSPVFLLIFLLLGAAAGMLNVVRSAMRMQAEAAQADASGKKDS